MDKNYFMCGCPYKRQLIIYDFIKLEKFKTIKNINCYKENSLFKINDKYILINCLKIFYLFNILTKEIIQSIESIFYKFNNYCFSYDYNYISFLGTNDFKKIKIRIAKFIDNSIKLIHDEEISNDINLHFIDLISINVNQFLMHGNKDDKEYKIIERVFE